jgi:hypothetical protein
VFKIDKINCITEIGNIYSYGFTELIEKLYLTSDTASTEFSSLPDSIRFTKRDGANANDKIIIPYGTEIPSTFNYDWETYIPVFPKWLCTSSTTSTPSPTNYSLFNFFNVKNSGTNYPGVRVVDSNNNLSLFRLDRSTNDVRVGAFDNSGINTGTVQIGGNNLELYSKTGIKFEF